MKLIMAILGGPNYGHPKKVGFIFIVTVCYLSILCFRGVLELVAEDFSNISGRKIIQKDQMAILYGPINGPKLCVTVIMVHWWLGTLITVTT